MVQRNLLQKADVSSIMTFGWDKFITYYNVEMYHKKQKGKKHGKGKEVFKPV